MPPIISALYSYPIKSCGGLAHDTVEMVATGPRFDRHWVITEPDGTFITQREYPKMALIQPQFLDGALSITVPNHGEVCVPLDERPRLAQRPVTVWRDTVLASDEGDEAANFLSSYLGLDVRLFHMPETTVRAVNPDFNQGKTAQVGFADGYPLLVVSDASLDDLNRRLEERGASPVAMQNFRPNMVVTGVDKPFAEDGWNRFTVGDITFDVVKPCARCSITTVNPQTGDVPNPKEPTATLATFRRGDNGGVLFGQNAIHRATGAISVGDALTIS
jgi:uncharacterized protein